MCEKGAWLRSKSLLFLCHDTICLLLDYSHGSYCLRNWEEVQPWNIMGPNRIFLKKAFVSIVIAMQARQELETD